MQAVAFLKGCRKNSMHCELHVWHKLANASQHFFCRFNAQYGTWNVTYHQSPRPMPILVFVKERQRLSIWSHYSKLIIINIKALHA